MKENQLFDDDIEGEMQTRAILEVPKFDPQISMEQLEELNAMDERDRRNMLPLLKTLSVVTQSFSWLVEQHIALTGNVRQLERVAINRRREQKTDWKWLWQTMAAAGIGAGVVLISNHL